MMDYFYRVQTKFSSFFQGKYFQRDARHFPFSKLSKWVFWRIFLPSPEKSEQASRFFALFFLKEDQRSNKQQRKNGNLGGNLLKFL